jgi:hypothetical protein
MTKDLQTQIKQSELTATAASTTSATSFAKDVDARIYLGILTVAATVMALAYALLVRPGSAGDEPAHYANVVFYAQNKCLPILGQPGVSYEGQMGPLYYALSAPVLAAFLSQGIRTAFFATRIFDVLLVPITVLLSYRIASLAKPGDKFFALATTTFMALNPCLLTIAASIQNDTLTLVLALVTSLACYQCMKDDRNLVRKGAFIGVLASATILTKASAVFLVVAVPFYALLCFRWRSTKFIASFGFFLAACTGWWFYRNITLYGDLTAQAALTKFNYNNNPPPFDFTVWSNFRYWIWSVEAYYWLPIQYYRDIFHTPLWLRGIVGLLTATGLVGAFPIVSKYVKSATQKRQVTDFFPLFLAVQYAVCMAVYIYSCARITNFAARVTFPTIIVYAAIIGSGCFLARRLQKSENVFLGLLTSGLIAGNVFVLWQLLIMPYFEFHNIFPPGC